MREIGIRELKTRASEIIRDVRDQHAQYVITYRGRPVGVLQPIGAPELGTPDSAAWDEFFDLAEAIGREWPSPVTTGEILTEMRR